MYYFIGIKGAGMSALALILNDLGYEVLGYDDEASHQSNCVERMYMDAVAEGKTHVVVVRYKNNPTDSFITCEVDNRGIILQYYILTIVMYIQTVSNGHSVKNMQTTL